MPGASAIVLDLVEGTTLDHRIAQGTVPIEEALPIACQIVGALEAAPRARRHPPGSQGGNIKLTPDGKVKVLDFGAKPSNALPEAVTVSVNDGANGAFLPKRKAPDRSGAFGDLLHSPATRYGCDCGTPFVNVRVAFSLLHVLVTFL
jgi:hypothetical protein